MLTQAMPERATGVAWLEGYSSEGLSIPRTVIETSPFLIGRDASATLQVRSSRVSREHCAITREGAAYRVQDLGSTNGTHLNGRRIETALLNDGDLLTLADTELSFFCSRAGSTHDTVTQVIPPHGSSDREEDVAPGIIRGVRHLHEMILHGCFEHLFQPVVRLTDGSPAGCEVVHAQDVELDGRSGAERMLLSTHCRLTVRLRQVQRLSAVDAAAGMVDAPRLFLRLDASEIVAGGPWDSFDRLKARLAAGQQLIVEVPNDAVQPASQLHDLRLRLHEIGIAAAHAGYAGPPGRLGSCWKSAPEYLQLAPVLSRGIHRNPQTRRQLEAILGEAADLGCEVIATGVRIEEEAAVLRELGCPFAQGLLFGSAQPRSALKGAAAAGAPPGSVLPISASMEGVAPCLMQS